MLWAYPYATSCPQGGKLRFRVGTARASTGGTDTARTDKGPPGDAQVRGTVTVFDDVDDALVFQSRFAGPEWSLEVGAGWRSSLYRAVFEPGEAPDNQAYFVVRPTAPTSAALLSVPFATWQAYNRAGVQGQGLYWTESPARATRVTFDRPGCVPPPERWEHGLMRWLRGTGRDVDYCSGLDLHFAPGLLDAYRLLLVVGHDEYWTWEMRDAVEAFTRRGGNLAVFGANTCWWQMRLGADRTMTCYRDAGVLRPGRGRDDGTVHRRKRDSLQRRHGQLGRGAC